MPGWADVEKGDPHGVAVLEAALLIEAGAAKDFDKIIVATCPFEQKVERYAHRAGISVEAARREVERRGAAQFSDEEKSRHADYVIDNSGPLERTEEQVERVWGELKAAAEGKLDIATKQDAHRNCTPSPGDSDL